jgi:cobalt/nickel transport system permease protein
MASGFPLLAVHISDGVLTAPWSAAGFALAGLLALVGAWRMRDDEIPRVAVLTAAFFVASLIAVRVGPTSVHLLLNGLVGVILGRRALLAIPVALFLQAALLGHGGFTSLGVNSCVMGLPALLAWQLFGVVRRLPWVRRPWFRSALVAASTLTWALSLVCSAALVVLSLDAGPARLDLGRAAAITFHPATLAAALALTAAVTWAERRLGNAPEFPVGLLVGEISVLATAVLNCAALLWCVQAQYVETSIRTVALAVLVAHLPIAVIEGVVLGFTVGFLAKVRPDLLGWPPAPVPTAEPAAASQPPQVPVKALGCLLAVAAGLLVPAGRAQAHALEAECEVLPGNKVRVSAWYSARPHSFPAQEARVRVLGPGDRVLREGQTDEKGQFVFRYERQEPLTVEVYQEGHRKVVALFGAQPSPSAAESDAGTAPVVGSAAGPHEEPVLKDVLIGVGFLLALAAFVLSVRNARHLRALAGGPPRPDAE